MIECKTCQKEIAKGVKQCPHCGKDQRSWFMRHKFLSFIGIIIILAIIGSALGGNDSTSDSKDDKEEKVYGIGDSAEIKGIKYTIVKVEEMDQIGDPEFLGKKAADGGTLVAVQYKMENVSDEPIGAFSYPTFKLVDDKGTEFNSDIDASAAYATETKIDNSKALSDLNPGITVEGTNAFEVSKESFEQGEWFIHVDKTKFKVK